MPTTPTPEAWSKIEKELEYVATYASPDRREELMRFLKGQFQVLLLSERQRIAEEVEGLKYEDPRRVNNHVGKKITWSECPACLENYHWNSALDKALAIINQENNQ